MQIFFETYGCAMNHADTSIMKNILQKNNHVIIDNIADSDIIILNTCTVREVTEKMIIRRVKNIKKDEILRNKKLIIAGCLPAAQTDFIRSIVPDVSLIGPNSIEKINSLIINQEPKIMVNSNDIREGKPIAFSGVISIIPISEGCINSCNYCIVKKARGELNSFKPSLIISQVEDMVKQGAKEIDITAQDTGSYGWDIGTTLPELLSSITKIRGSFQIRVGMMNPDSLLKILPELMQVFESEKIFKFLHIPIQSADDNVLKKMNRKYTLQDFMGIVKAFRNKFPEISIATDIIVGYPSESDGAFNKSLNLLKKFDFDKVHVARYSPRPGTVGAKLKQVNSEIKKQRSTLLAKQRLISGKKINEKWVNRKVEVVITSRSPRGQLEGRTESYKPVIILGSENWKDELIGKRFQVEIKKIGLVSLFGEKLN